MTTSINKLRKLLELAAEFKVSELELDGMRVVIDVPAQMMSSKRTPDTINDEDAKIDQVKTTLEDLLKDKETDLFYSV